MRKITYRIAVVCLAIGFTMTSIAQDIHLSNFDLFLPQLNPAMTGDFDKDLRASSVYRSQWTSMGSPFKTKGAAFEMPVLRRYDDANFMGVGLAVLSDQAGKTNFGQTQIRLNLAYTALMNLQWDFSGGISVDYNQRSVNLQGLKWDNQYTSYGYDPTRPDGESGFVESANYIGVSAGVAFQYIPHIKSQSRFGFSVFEANAPKVGAITGAKIPRRYTLHYTGDFLVGRYYFYVEPMFIAQYQGGAKEITFGGFGRWQLGDDSRYTNNFDASSVGAGLLYRVGDAIVILTRYEWKHRLKLGLSYDVNVSRLRAATSMRGGFEVYLSWSANIKQRRRKLKNPSPQVERDN